MKAFLKGKGRVFGAFLLPVFLAFSFFFPSCASQAASAEEYFSIGMAYYELGKFAEAEKWLNRARSVNRTMVASEYNLGRIAFETGRYEEAVKHFEKILERDPRNVMALRAAAYGRIKKGDIEEAEALYVRVLALVPEEADDGYNYALVLYAMEKYDQGEAVLLKHPYALDENQDALLLLARTQKALNKVEAADNYAKWIGVASQASPQVLYEYAQVLEAAGLYARALEQYRAAAAAIETDTETLKKSSLRFESARLLLTADSGSDEGITELDAAVAEGFDDTEALEKLLDHSLISEAHKDGIRKALDRIKNPPAEAETQESEADIEGGPDKPEE
ncbi:MAG: tetratricopeptide repeat protein [Treponema sp.]|jgi:tetratricopeptide (TPR) repeat protein|nr:tetratricopeptide repeat protein [Treponema sp.]